MDLLKSQVILPVSPKGAGSIPAGPRDGTTARPVGRLAANRQCHRPRFLKNKEDLKSLRCYATFRLVVTFWRRLSGSLPSHKNRPQWFRIRPLGRHERDRGRAGRYGKVVGSVAVVTALVGSIRSTTSPVKAWPMRCATPKSILYAMNRCATLTPAPTWQSSSARRSPNRARSNDKHGAFGLDLPELKRSVSSPDKGWNLRGTCLPTTPD